MAATEIKRRSATRNCPFPNAERLPGVGRTWSVHQPARESPSCPTSSLSTNANGDIEEIHPVGDTHGGLPWKTTMKIPAFSPVRQESSRHGSTRIDCHNVSRGGSPSRIGTRSGLPSLAELRLYRTQPSTLNTRASELSFWPWHAMAIA